MTVAEYRVQLDLYEGPLDLLLYLVRRNEVDILELPIATITEQFLEFQEVLEFLDLEGIGDFLVTAAALLELKSHHALPSPEAEEEPISDDEPHSDFIHRLLEYKRFKEASQALEERAAEWLERYPRLSDSRPDTPKNPAADRIKDVELWDLVSALGRVLKTKEVDRHSRIQYDDTPMSVYIERIGSRVRREGRTAFSTFFEGTNQRTKIVSVFLAVLELLRHHHFRAEQPVDFGEIWVLPPAAESNETPDPASE
ncbi:MAG: segregation/condensation protein A [Planctomycetaceae bacterium]